ncbi:MAG: SDR family oxidoreductase [Lysobacterales bacterium]
MAIEQPTVLITGANRGLGLEFVRQYLDRGWQVLATCRKPDQAASLKAVRQEHLTLRILPLDVADFSAVDELAEELDGSPIDVLLNNAGVFGPKPKAEKDLRQSLGHVDYSLWADIFQINTQAPVKLAEALLPNLLQGRHKKIVTISSTEGSIANAHAGLYAYRTSKAAVNMATALLAGDLNDQQISVLSLNPGWVKTDMGGPQAELELAFSIQSMLKVIDQLSLSQSGQFLNFDGSALAW